MRTVFVLLAVGMLAGCVTKEWAATGGSRADGVVRLSYEASALVSAETNDQQGLQLAIERCQMWGYSGAEAFGGTTRQCNAPGALSGCASYLYTKEFQCTGSKSAPE